MEKIFVIGEAGEGFRLRFDAPFLEDRRGIQPADHDGAHLALVHRYLEHGLARPADSHESAEADLLELVRKLHHLRPALRGNLPETRADPPVACFGGPVVVRHGDYKKHLSKWKNKPSRTNWRHLQPFIVNVFEYEARNFIQNRVMQDLGNNLYLWNGKYDDKIGAVAEYDPADLIA